MCGWRDARKPLCSVVFLLLRPNAFFLLPWRSIKHTDMKTWMMTLGLLTMAATITAQDARMGSRNDGKGGAHRTHIIPANSMAHWWHSISPTRRWFALTSTTW